MNLTEFIQKFSGFADRTDKKLEEVLTKHRAEIDTEREKVSKLEASIATITSANALLEADNAKLKASIAELQSTNAQAVADAKASADKIAGEKAANIVASAGFAQNVPAENQNSGNTKAEHWKRFNSLPIADRYAYYKANREAMAD